MRKDKTRNDNEEASKQNRISKGTSITGEIVSEGDFRIDGTLDGNIRCAGKVVIGKHGVLKGTLICKEADLEGTVDGSLTTQGLLNLRSSAVIKGEVATLRLSVEPGADFNATCIMGEQVKTLSKDEATETGKSA